MASDDGFREIQLNGKQLVFLFMATTIVAVVIFLCGVMVGRGVRNAAAATATPVAAVPPAGDVGAVPDVQAGAKTAAQPASTTPPPVPLEDAAPDAGKGVPATAPPATAASGLPATAAPAPPAAAVTAAPAVDRKPATSAAAQQAPPPPAPTPAGQGPAASGGTAVPGEPADKGFALQVAALNEKEQAEAIARRLLDKGYAAYMIAPQAAGGMFRVRVGKFKERRQADAVVRRLKKEEQLEPWIIPPTR